MAKFSITAIIGVVTDKLKKGLTDARSKVGKLGASFSSAMGHPAVQAAAQAGKAIVAFGVDAVKTAGKIDASMNEVFTLLPGMAEGAKKKMTKEMLDLSSKMGKMPADMVGSLYNALSAGIPKENVFNFLETASKAAIGGVATTEQAVGALTTVLNGYKMPASEAANVSDTLFTIIKNGVTTMPELAANIGKVTPMAASLGIQFEEVGAAFAEMTKNLGPGKSAETGTMLKAMLAELAKGGSKAAMAFERIAGKSFPDFVKEGGSLQEALQLMSKDADTTGVRITDFFGSIEAGQAALILAQNNAKGLGDQMVEMGKKKGAASEAFKTVDQGFSRMMEKLMAGFEQFKHTVGTALKPVVDVVMPLFLKGLKMIQGLPWDKLGKVLGEHTKALEPLVDMIFELAKELFPIIASLMKSNTGILKALMPIILILLKLLVLILPPIAWIIEKLAWLVSLLGELGGFFTKLIMGIGKGKDDVVDDVKEVKKEVSKVSAAMAKANAWIKKAFAWIVTNTKAYLKQAKEFWTKVFTALAHLRTIILWPFKKLWGAFVESNKRIIAFLGMVRAKIKGVRDWFFGLFESAKAKIYETFPWLEDLVDYIQNFIKEKVQEIWTRIKDTLTEMWNRLKKVFSDLRKKVFESKTETGKALQFFWKLAEDIFKKFLKFVNAAWKTVKKLGDVLGWVGKKLGLVKDETDGVNTALEKTNEELGKSKDSTKEQADLVAKEKADREAAAEAEEKKAAAAALSTAEAEKQKAAAAEIAAQTLAREKMESRVLGLEHELVKKGAKIIMQSGVNVKLLQATIGKHKDINSLADLYSIVGSGKKTPAQIIEEAKKHQAALNKKAQDFALKNKKNKTPADQVKDATEETKKLNAEAKKNPLLNMGKGGIEVKATMTLDPNTQKLLFQRLAGIHHDTSAIYHQLKGKFTNQ